MTNVKDVRDGCAIHGAFEEFCPNCEWVDEGTDDTSREDEPGAWVIADFDGECSRGGEIFAEDDTIRADGDGGWECQACVDADKSTPMEVVDYQEWRCRMRIYLAGPMRGRPDLNRPAFAKATALLRADGHEVFSPPEYDATNGLDAGSPDGLREALAVDLTWICRNADAVVVLAGWEKSLGATAEVATAHALSLPVWAIADFAESGEQAPRILREAA